MRHKLKKKWIEIVRSRSSALLRLSFLTSLVVFPVLAVSGQAAYAADIQPVTFTDNPDPVAARGLVVYTIDVHNNQHDAATNPTLDLTVPTGFSFDSVDDANCTYSGATPSGGGAGDIVHCAWPSLAGDTSNIVNITLKASDTAATYSVTATATCQGDTNGANNESNNNTDVIASADLVLAGKTSTPNPIAAGGIVTYRFEVRNDGPQAATDLVLSDQLPVGLTFLADNSEPASDQDNDWSCSAAGQNVSCTASTLANGATTVFYFRAKVIQDTTGAITNTASVNSATPDTGPDNNTNSDNLTVQEGTDMAIAKTVDTDPVIGGQPVHFTVTATNEGPMTATNVSVTDTLPSGYTAITVTAPPGWTCDDPVVGTQVTCTNPNLPPGQSAPISITATPPTVNGVVTHQNLATALTDTTDPISDNDNVTVTYSVSPDIADLAIAKSKSPDPVAQGEKTYSTIIVSNNGPREADPVQVVDVLSDGETYLSFQGTDWNCSHSGSNPGGTVTCNYTNLPLAAGAQAPSLKITTEATNAGDLENTACTGGSGGSVAPAAGDSLTGNNCSNGSVSSTSEIADLQVTKSTSDSHITENENSFTYSVNITNNGPNAAEAVDFKDTIPQYVSAGTGGRPATGITATPTQGTCNVTGGQVYCALGNIANGQTVTVNMVVTRPMREGTLTNSASAFSTVTGDPDLENNTDDVDVTVDPVTDIEVSSKTVTYSNHPAAIYAGTHATYTIQVRNNGPSTAANVSLADVFSGASFTYISSSVAGGGTCTFAAPTLSCDLGNMNSATTKSITVVIRPDEVLPNPDPWEIDNTATVSMTTKDSDATNNAQTLTLEVQDGQTDIAIEKQESIVFQEPVRFAPGADNYIVYAVKITNRGPSLATGLIFVDNVKSVSPAQAPVQQLQFIRDTENADGTAGTPDICTIGTNPFDVDGTDQNITCTVADDLASGDDYIRFLVFKVLNAPGVNGDVYYDEVTVTGNETETNTVNNTEGEGTTVRTVADLELTKTGPAGAVDVEQPFNFTLAVANHGPGASPDTVVTDNLPANMELTATPVPSTGSCSGSAGSTSFTCSLGIVSNGDTASITLPVKITAYPAGGTISNSASVAGGAPEPDVDPHSNSDTEPVTVNKPAVLGDYVWLDADANGIQDGGEPGISGVTVNLYDAAAPGVIVQTTTTNGSGLYSFTINHASNYIVEFVNPDPGLYFPSPQDQGADDARDSDAAAGNGRTGSITINYGDNNQSVDAGMYQKLTLGNRVWEDRNADGVQDAGELPIPGVAVDLLDDTLTVVASTTTDANGEYQFTDLDPGDYSVRITPPSWAGYLPSPVQTADPDNNNNSDSNIDLALNPPAGSYQSGVITLASGTEPANDGDADNNTNLSMDFGLVLPASVGNFIWLDENLDGIQDAGEPGIANVTVQLKDSDGNVIAETVTDGNGGYLFTDVPPGDYFVAVVPASLPAGMEQTALANEESDFGNQTQARDGYPVHLASGEENLTADFGYNYSPVNGLGALGDRIWIDSNGNGVQDDGEPGVSGAEVTLYSAGPDGLMGTADDVAEATTTTDADGNYIFDNLAAGQYTVEVTNSGAANHDILGADYNQTGDPDHFGADSSTAPTGTAGDNRSTRPIVIAPGDTFVNADFGYQPQDTAPVHDIGSTVWMDANRDGVQDDGEPGIPGVVIGLKDADGNFIATTTTDENGDYLFTDLPNGAYTVVVIDSENVLEGLDPTYDADSLLVNPDEESHPTLSGADNLDQNFGYAPRSPNAGTGMIGDTIFLDRDGNGTPDPGEGLEGVVVTLRDNNGNIIARTTTDENGHYFFGGLPAGDYMVEVDQTTLPSGVSNTIDPDGGNDSVSAVTLADGEVNLDQDFGYTADVPGSIGNQVFNDTNADGEYQPDGVDGIAGTADDETPIEGVTLDLYQDTNHNGQIDPGEPKIGSTVTDAAGNYLFSGLPGGDYNVKVTDKDGKLGGLWHSKGADDTNDNSQDDQYPVTLPAGGTVDTADFGYYSQPGSLGDRVWNDVDGNGVYDPAVDSGIAGVTVFLEIVYPDGTTITLQTVTDSDGLYEFHNLLLDEKYNGIGNDYGERADEPSHTVRVDETTLPADLVSTWPVRGSNTDTTTVGGAAGDEDNQDMGSDNPDGEPGYPPMGSADITNDFGYFTPSSIGDTIWHDMDNDGVVDPGEGLAGVTVTLTPPTDVDLGNGPGTPVTVDTNASGEYAFEGLPPGEYTVTVDENDLPPELQGFNTVDPDGGNDSTATVNLGVGEKNVDQDFAYFHPGSIGNYVWDDSNGNGIQDPGESGHQGITVRLLDSSGNPVMDPSHAGVPYIMPTGPNGEYLFENLVPGEYQVEFVLPSNNTFTSANSGGDDAADSDADPATGRTAVVVLGPSESDLTIDAGLTGPGISIEKATNGQDADEAPGVSLNVGEAVTWTYVVTNTGNVTLTGISVTDDKLGAVSCPETTLAAGASMTCTANGTAEAGQYANTGSVVATPPTGEAVVDTDMSHYIAVSPAPAVDIEKYTNGVDADTGSGPIIAVGDPVTWTYVVTNTGNVGLTGVAVTDDKIGPITCPKTILAVGESMTCTVTGTSVAGQYTNTGSVSGTPDGGGAAVSDTDPSHYLGVVPGTPFASVDIEKSTNGEDADQGRGPDIEIGQPATFTYVVTNTGLVDLSNVTVTDNRVNAVDIHCPDDGNTDNRITSLAVGASVTCTATAPAIAGQYENTGSVVGTPPNGPDVTDTDRSHYYGSNGSVDIEKYTNGEDADQGRGPRIKTGEDVLWTYVVTNTGLFPLSGVNVVDDQGVVVSCPKTTLAVNESMTCTGQGEAIDGQYENIGTVEATTPGGNSVTDVDASHYFGKSFYWPMFMPALINPCKPIPDFCYMIADGDNEGSNDSPLFKYTFEGNKLELVNRLGVADVEAIVISLDGRTVYATDNGVFGTIDETAGIEDAFTPVDPTARDAGIGRGALGPLRMQDIDGLAFDPKSGILYGSNRLADGIVGGQQDLLIQLNPETGKIIPNAFGEGIDYVVIDAAAVGASDIDDIAIDTSGTIYGIAGTSGGAGLNLNNHLVIIDPMTGAVTDQGPLHFASDQIQDLEGLTLYNNKTLFGTTGTEFVGTNTANSLYKIDKASGETTFVSRLDKNFDGLVPRDFEAIECLPICK